MSFILAGLFTLFLIVSFISISDAYGVDNEITTSSGITISSDIDTDDIDDSLSKDLNQNDLVLDDTFDSYSGIIQNTSNETNKLESSNGTTDTTNSLYSFGAIENVVSQKDSCSVPNASSVSTASSSDKQYGYVDSEDYNYLNDNCKCNNNNYLTDNRDNLDKLSEKSFNLDNIDFNSFYSIQYYNFINYEEYYNNLNDYINNNIVIITLNSNSNLNFSGNGFDNSNNLIKEVSNLNFAKVDDADDTSTIGDLQSSFKLNLTILLFIKIFMEHHDNGKEHLNSF